MPGLVGIIKLKQNCQIDEAIFNKMCQSIYHRNWYKIDSATSKSYRVAKIHHGFFEKDYDSNHPKDENNRVLVYGEAFYNKSTIPLYPSLIEKLYHKQGFDFFSKISGSFLIFLYDTINQKHLIVSDRISSRQIYWYQNDDYFFFSPEYKAFLTLDNNFNKEIDENAISNFLSAGYLYNGTTYFSKVRKLDNATIIEIQNNKITHYKYWDFTFNIRVSNCSKKQCVAQSVQLIKKIVKRSAFHSEPLSIMLSGGLDSRAILSALKNIFNDVSSIFTVTWGTDENVSGSDPYCALQLSKISNTNHVFFRINPDLLVNNVEEIIYLNEGCTDAIGNYSDGLTFFKILREKYKIQTIIRGDQCFTGGNYVFEDKDILPKNGIYPINKISQYSEIFNRDKYIRLDELNKKNISTILSKYSKLKLHEKKDIIYLDQRLKYYLNSLSTLKQFEIEQRNPFLNNDFFDFVLSTPFRFRKNKLFFKLAIKKLNKKIYHADIATLNSDVDWLDEFMKNESLQQFIYQTLLLEKNSFDQYVDKNKLKLFLDNVFNNNNHLKKPSLKSRNISFLKELIKKSSLMVKIIRLFRKTWIINDDIVIFRLLVLKIWFGIFYDQNNEYGSQLARLGNFQFNDNVEDTI